MSDTTGIVMPRKVVEPEHFVYIVLGLKEDVVSFEYLDDFQTIEEAEKLAGEVEETTKIIRARKATVLRFLKRAWKK